MKTIDISKPRRMYWSHEADLLHGCPECNKELVNENQMYLAAIAGKTGLLSFMMTNNGGHFCPECPVVVLDREIFINLAIAASGSPDEPVFAVAGIVDSDAIPEDKKDLPYGHDDNPIPLVKFMHRKDQKLESIDEITPPVEKPVKARKIGRNEPCPCGSGKKYKKCCL